MENIKQKTCSSCGNVKAYSDFTKCPKSSDGLKTYCRTCVSEYNKARRLRPSVVEKRKRLGYKICSKCGEKKSLDAFSTKKRNPDGLKYSCKDCDAEYRLGRYVSKKTHVKKKVLKLERKKKVLKLERKKRGLLTKRQSYNLIKHLAHIYSHDPVVDIDPDDDCVFSELF